jgi:peptide/nickel transport system substrate-binding protein
MFKKFMRIAVFLSTIVFLLGACGPKPETVVPTDAPQQAPTSAPVEPALPPEQHVFTVAIPDEVNTFDPAFTNDWQSSVLVRGVYDPLFRARGEPIQNEPWLAESFDVNSDATVWTIHLRPNIKFHDGSPVNAEAVKYTFDRYMALQAGYYFLWSGITTADTVKVVDDVTVEFTLTKPFTPFISTLAAIYVVNPVEVKAHEVDGDWGKAWLVDHEAGSGPYAITRWEPGSIYELSRLPEHWAGFTYKEDGISVFRYLVYRETGTARLALETGEIDWMPGLTEEDYTLLKDKEGFTTLFRPGLTVDYIFMNTASDGPMGDVNVRKALRHAYDYAASDEVLFDINGVNYLLPPGIPAAVEYPDLRKTDLDLARQYLAQSEYPDGGFSIDYIYVTGYSPEEDAGLVLLEAASKLNITVNMIPKTWPEMVEMCSTVESVPDTINIFIGTIYADPYPFLGESFSKNSPLGYSTCHNYLSQTVTDKLDQAGSASDLDLAASLYKEVQDELYESVFGIMIGAADFAEAHSNHWQVDAFTPLFAYVGWLTDYHYVP